MIIGLGCEQCKGYEMVEQLKDTGKPFTYLEVQQEGGPAPTVAHGKEIAAQLVKEAAAQPREKFPISELIVAVQCGGSDWTTALTGNVAVGTAAEHLTAAGASVIISEVGGLPGSEHLLARQAVTKEVGLKIIDMTDARRDYFFKKNGKTLTEANPTPGNKDGGITTLVENRQATSRKSASARSRASLACMKSRLKRVRHTALTIAARALTRPIRRHLHFPAHRSNCSAPAAGLRLAAH